MKEENFFTIVLVISVIVIAVIAATIKEPMKVQRNHRPTCITDNRPFFVSKTTNDTLAIDVHYFGNATFYFSNGQLPQKQTSGDYDIAFKTVGQQHTFTSKKSHCPALQKWLLANGWSQEEFLKSHAGRWNHKMVKFY